MNLLHVVRRLDPRLGGAPTAAADIAGALIQRGGIRVTLATTVAPRDPAEQQRLSRLAPSEAAVMTFPRSMSLPYDFSGRLAQWMHRQVPRFDCVEIHGVFDFPAVCAMSVATRANVPYIIHPHGSLDPFDLAKHSQAKRLMGKRFLAKHLEHASTILATTEEERKRLNLFGARARTDAIGIPYAQSNLPGNPLRFRRKIGSDQAFLLFLGRVDYKKGVSHLIDGVRLFREQGFCLSLVVAGDATTLFAKHIQAEAVDRLGDAVHFVGHLDETERQDALAAAQALALVSDNENYGLVLVDAARAGLPMILSDQVYLAPVLQQYGAAMVVPRTAPGVAEGLRRIVASPEVRASMSAACSQAARDLFSWTRLADEHVGLRHSLLNAGLQ